MNKSMIVKSISGFVFLAGVIVMLGWVWDIDLIKSILPHAVTMRFTTAVCFSLSGITLYFMARFIEGEKETARLVLSASIFAILLIMCTLFFSIMLGIRTGIEDLFIKEGTSMILATTPGRPSLGTMFDFILIAMGGLIIMFDWGKSALKLSVIGGIVGIVGLTAIAGYIFHVPLLYYAADGISTDMAIHTAILFALIGFGFILLGKE